MKKYYYFYKLCCNECEEVYVGKTFRLCNRLKQHKSHCNNINSSEYNRKIYTCIRENGGWDQWLMYIIHEGEYTLEESKKIERKYIETYGTLNIEIPNRSKEEYNILWNECNKEHRQKYMRNFNQKNYQQNKDALIKRSREFYEKNKDAINLKKKLYYQKNKVAIQLKRRLNRAKKKNL